MYNNKLCSYKKNYYALSCSKLAAMLMLCRKIHLFIDYTVRFVWLEPHDHVTCEPLEWIECSIKYRR